MKNILFTAVLLITFLRGYTQKIDTTIVYLKLDPHGYPKKVFSIDSADYYHIITSPDSTDSRLYTLNEYSKDNNLRMIVKFFLVKFDAYASDKAQFQGPCISYYPNKRKKLIEYFENGVKTGQSVSYYSNGKIYCIYEHSGPLGRNVKLIDCYDSLGVQTAKDGNGHWLKYDDSMKNVWLEGDIKNGIMEGNWYGKTADKYKIKYSCTYVKGLFKTGMSEDSTGQVYHFDKILDFANYRAPMGDIFDLLTKKLKYGARHISYEKTLTVDFKLGADGTIGNFEVKEPVDKDLYNAAVNFLKNNGHWAPFKYFGKPIPVTLKITLNQPDTRAMQLFSTIFEDNILRDKGRLL